MAKHKQRGKVSPAPIAPHEKRTDKPAQHDEPRDPLRAFPADPPRPNRALLILAAALFALWFCYLAYVALLG